MIQNSTKNESADKFWKKLMGEKHAIETIRTLEGSFKSSIEFFDKRIQEESIDEAKSRIRVATVALDKLFGISLPQGASNSVADVLKESYQNRAKGKKILSFN